MLTRFTAILLSACLASCVPSVQANLPRTEADIWKVEIVSLPRITYPSEAVVLRALPKGPPRNNIRIQFEVQRYRVEPSRFYPLVGVARLVEAHFKCIVTSSRGREVVFIDMSRLGPAK